MWLGEQGVDLKTQSNAALSSLADSLQKLNRADNAKAQSPHYLKELLDAVKNLKSSISTAVVAHQKIVAWAETEIASAGEHLLHQWDKLEESDRKFVRELVLTASSNPRPEYDDKYYAEWKSASWSPAPRNEAAKSLPWLLLKLPDDQDVKDAIRNAAKDQVPTVRFLLASEVWRIYEKNAAFLVEILNGYIADEPNATVLDAVCLGLQNASHLQSVRDLIPGLYGRMSAEAAKYDYRRT